MLCVNASPEEAYDVFKMMYPSFPPFHDASPCVCTYNLTIFDCLKGLEKARMYNFFNFDNFNVEEYEHFEQVENGDLNWIVDGKVSVRLLSLPKSLFLTLANLKKITVLGLCRSTQLP